MSGGCVEVCGRLMRLPVLELGVLDGERLAGAIVVPGATRMGADLVDFDLSTDAVDLSLASTGRAPLLLEHQRYIDSLLGMIVSAGVRGRTLECLVRFARGREADRIWSLLAQGFPVSLSIGTRVTEAVRAGTCADGSTWYRVTRWRLEEISVVLYGADENATLRMIERGAELEKCIRRARGSGTGSGSFSPTPPCPNDWQRWATIEGPQRLAERFGLPVDEVREALRFEADAYMSREDR